MINKDFTVISGDKPENFINTQITTNKTSDEIGDMVNQPQNFLSKYGLGYVFEDEIKENILPIKEYNKNDVLDKDENIELPDIYNIDNIGIVTKLKGLISLINAEDKESDKVAIFADFIKKVKLNNISTKYKKALINLLKEKL